MRNKVIGPNEIFKAVVVKCYNIILVVQYILKIKSIKSKNMKAIFFTMYTGHNKETLKKDKQIQTDQGC